MSAPPVMIVAEPDPLISSVLRVEFTQMDFAVLMAATAPEAEEYVAHAIASLVVLDVGALGLAGYSACLHIRRRSGYADRPIVLTSGGVSERTRAAAKMAGATVLLPKPYSVSDLLTEVTPHLPAGDPLLTHRAAKPGLAQAWTTAPAPAVTAGRNS